MAEQQAARQGITPGGCGGNVVSTTDPVFIMLPTPAPTKQKIAYDKRLPRIIVLTLSCTQILMAVVAIFTQLGLLVPSVRSIGPYFATDINGFLCGVMFGFSGAFGIIAGLKPSRPTIVTFMVFSIVAACFCLPLLVFSAIGTAYFSYGYSTNYRTTHALFVIQIIISLIQVIAAISSSSLTCRAICSCCACCRPTEDTGVVYYSSTVANGLNNKITPQIGYPQSQPGYITIPISQLQAAAGQTAYLTSTGAAIGDNPPAKADTPNSEYESAPMLERKNEEVKG